MAALTYVPDVETAQLVCDKAEDLRTTGESKSELLQRAARELGFRLQQTTGVQIGDGNYSLGQTFEAGAVVLVNGEIVEVTGPAVVKIGTRGLPGFITARPIPRYGRRSD